MINPLRQLPVWALVALGAAGCSQTPTEQSELATRTEEAPSPGPAKVRLPEELLSNGRVAVAPLQRGPVPRTVTVSGWVKVTPDGVAVLSASSDARVATIAVRPGQVVAKGDLLMRLDAPAVAVARADLQRSRAMKERAQLLVEQEQRLRELRATNTRDSSLAHQELALANAQQVAAEGSLRAWGASGGGGASVTLVAPVSGIVSQLPVERGSTVTTGTQLIRLMQPDALSVTANVPQAVARFIALARAHIAFLGAGNEPCPARVLGHLHRVDGPLGTVPFQLLPERECAASLFEGATVEVEMPLMARPSDEQLVHVAASAITRLDGDSLVFVQAGPDTFEPQRVTDVEVWGDQAYFRWTGPSDAQLATTGAVLLKGELTRGELE